MNNIISGASRWISSFNFRNQISLAGKSAVVSFSFDDAPKSSCHEGRSVLEKFGCHGTWYIAGGLTDKFNQGQLCHSQTDIINLFKNGHQIGCHTFSHTACDSLVEKDFELEIFRNFEFLKNTGLMLEQLHFSFPFGAYNLRSKRIASRHFSSTRITGGGFHVDHADLNALKAERLYQGLMTPKNLSELIKDVSKKRGWLILYTHDVTPNPTEWGCTENLLDYALQSALTAGCKIMPVDQAIRYYSDKIM